MSEISSVPRQESVQRENKTWEQFVQDIEKLIEQMGTYRPDIIIPSMVGGLVPAGILAERLGIKDIRPISIERRGDERTIVYDVRGDINGKDVLLLEDDLPTGAGFVVAKKKYTSMGARVKIAAVYVNPQSEAIADYYGEKRDPLPNLPWKPARAGDRIVESK